MTIWDMMTYRCKVFVISNFTKAFVKMVKTNYLADIDHLYSFQNVDIYGEKSCFWFIINKNNNRIEECLSAKTES